MPFIITTKRPSPDCVECRKPCMDVVSHRAVATLEEARKACLKIVRPYATQEARGPAGGAYRRDLSLAYAGGLARRLGRPTP